MLKKNKKGAVLDFYFHWPEIVSLFLLVVGFIVSVSSGSAIMSYLVVFFCGLFFGRMWYVVQKTIKMPWFVIIFCFLVGYLLGNFYGNFKIIIISFVLGCVISFYLHQRKVITTKSYAM